MEGETSMSKTLRKAMRDINTHQCHLEAVAKKIDVLRRRTASKGRKKKVSVLKLP
jgi:hypothetical protein